MDRYRMTLAGFKQIGLIGWIRWRARKTIFKLFFLGSGCLSFSGLPLKRLAAFLCGALDSRRGIVGSVIDLPHGRVGFLVDFTGVGKLTEHQPLCFFAQSVSLWPRLFSLFLWVYLLVLWLERFLYSNVRNG